MTTHPLLRGAVDTHVHAGPAYIRRRSDAVTMARAAAEAGMSTLVLKDHHAPSATLAAQVDELVPGISVRGSIVLNATVGGINLSAVEASLATGAAMVWLPTVSSAAHHRAVQLDGARFPSSGRSAAHSVDDIVPVVDEEGHLTRSVQELLDLLTEHEETTLATGHVSADEVTLVVDAARARGLERLIVTHPDYIVGASLEQMKAWVRAGALCEIAGSTSWSRSSLASIPPERTARVIDEVGAQGLVLASDFGQRDNPPHVDALSSWIEELLAAGTSEEHVRQMLVDNPARVLAGSTA